jgi:hypothetical protein
MVPLINNAGQTLRWFIEDVWGAGWSASSTASPKASAGRPGRGCGPCATGARGPGPAAHPGTYLFTPEQWQPRLAEFCQLVRKPSGAAEAIAQVKDELHLALTDLEETLANRAPRTMSARSAWIRRGSW